MNVVDEGVDDADQGREIDGAEPQQSCLQNWNNKMAKFDLVS